MRVAVMAAGAVGGYFGARIAAAGHDVVFIARGAHRDAIRRDGLKIESTLGDLHLNDVNVTDDPKQVGPVLTSRSRTASKGAGGNCRVEGIGRKTPWRDRRHGWTARQDQEDHSTRDRRRKQRDGSLHGRPSGIKRGRREAFRKPSALHNLPWRIRGGNAGPAHT
jgi:hypothetical protein